MKVFHIKVLIVDRSQVVSSLMFFMLTDTWAIDISFEKLTLETGR